MHKFIDASKTSRIFPVTFDLAQMVHGRRAESSIFQQFHALLSLKPFPGTLTIKIK